VFHSKSLTSLNSYGYSPHPLSDYLVWIGEILVETPERNKPFIISITATDGAAVSSMVKTIQSFRHGIGDDKREHARIGIELNMSCPNIQGNPPTGYTITALKELVDGLAVATKMDESLTVGIKLPPYVHSGQITEVVGVLEQLDHAGMRVAFVTCTNTLGNSILFDDQCDTLPRTRNGPESSVTFALPTVYGGMAGEFLHPLALGNVHAINELLKQSHAPRTADIAIIGVGGISSYDAVGRMRRAGASAVACASALGKEGIAVFARISKQHDSSNLAIGTQ